MLGRLGVAAAARGDRRGAERVLTRILSVPAKNGRRLYARARIYARLGDRDRAMALLREAFAQGMDYGMHLHTECAFEPLRGYPPYEELIRPKG